MKALVFRVAHRHIRLGEGSDATTWPFPFEKSDLHQDAAWKARYAPETLTKAEAMELAGIANAYMTLVTHPCRSVRARMHEIHRAWKRWLADGEK